QERRRSAPAGVEPGDRHRGRVQRRRALALLHERTRRLAAELPPRPPRRAAGGGNAERVTFAGSYNISPTVSPDGRTLAYITRAGNAFRLVVLDLATAGAQPQPITDTSDDEHPSFAPNG